MECYIDWQVKCYSLLEDLVVFIRTRTEFPKGEKILVGHATWLEYVFMILKPYSIKTPINFSKISVTSLGLFAVKFMRQATHVVSFFSPLGILEVMY